MMNWSNYTDFLEQSDREVYTSHSVPIDVVFLLWAFAFC